MENRKEMQTSLITKTNDEVQKANEPVCTHIEANFLPNIFVTAVSELL